MTYDFKNGIRPGDLLLANQAFYIAKGSAGVPPPLDKDEEYAKIGQGDALMILSATHEKLRDKGAYDHVSDREEVSRFLKALVVGTVYLYWLEGEQNVVIRNFTERGWLDFSERRCSKLVAEHG